MRFARINPRVVWVALGGAFAAALAHRLGVERGLWARGLNPNTPFALMMAASYVVSLVLCWKIAQDHKGSAAMRWAWLLFAGSSAMSVVRHTLQAVVASGAAPGFSGAAAYVPVQLPMAAALVMFFVGLIAMWNALSGLGLGFQARGADIALVTVMLLMLPPILIRNPERLPAGLTGWVVILPYAGAILLPACGGIAVLLHRVTVEMGGGEAARALRYLIWFPGLRLVAMLISVDPRLRTIPLLTVPAYAIYQVAPLVFLLAVVYRWQITVKAAAAMSAEPSAWSEMYQPAGTR